jgi:predicted HicB family RNase H-like nuclease
MNENQPQKRGRGRPQTRPKNPVQIRCELSPEDHEAATNAARAKGKSLSQFAHDAVMDAVKKVDRPGR